MDGAGDYRRVVKGVGQDDAPEGIQDLHAQTEEGKEDAVEPAVVTKEDEKAEGHRHAGEHKGHEGRRLHQLLSRESAVGQDVAEGKADDEAAHGAVEGLHRSEAKQLPEVGVAERCEGRRGVPFAAFAQGFDEDASEGDVKKNEQEG